MEDDEGGNFRKKGEIDLPALIYVFMFLEMDKYAMLC